MKNSRRTSRGLAVEKHYSRVQIQGQQTLKCVLGSHTLTVGSYCRINVSVVLYTIDYILSYSMEQSPS